MHGDGIGSEQAQRAPHHHIDLLRSRCSLEMEWSKQHTSGMEERKPRVRVGGLVVAPCQHVRVRYTGVARVSGRGGRVAAGAARGGVGTTDVREAVATTDVGRGGGGVLGVAGRVAWA